MVNNTSKAFVFSPEPRRHIIEDFLVVWLDSQMKETDADYQTFFTQLRYVVDSLSLFTDADRCVDYLTEIKDEKAFMIVSSSFDQQLVPLIH